MMVKKDLAASFLIRLPVQAAFLLLCFVAGCRSAVPKRGIPSGELPEICLRICSDHSRGGLKYSLGHVPAPLPEEQHLDLRWSFQCSGFSPKGGALHLHGHGFGVNSKQDRYIYLYEASHEGRVIRSDYLELLKEE